MTFEKSHGKARPTLVRASDLRPHDAGDTARERTDGRSADGKFAAGNRAATARGFRMTLKKLLGPRVDSDEAKAVRRDAWRVLTTTLATMPSDAAPVRAMVSLYAGHVALAAYYRTLASAKGLASKRGLELLAVSDRQSQRAERVLVTAHDLARLHAEQENKTPRTKPKTLREELAEGMPKP